MDYSRILKSIEAHMLNAVEANDNAKSFKKERRLVINSMREDGSKPYQEVKSTFGGLKIKCLLSMQRANTTLIELGMDYQDRKVELENLYQRLWLDKLTEENIRLEA